MVAFLEIHLHGCRGDVEGNSVHYHEHHECLDIEERKVAVELCFNDGTYVCQVCTLVVDVANGSACGDGGADLTEVLL